MRTTRCDQCEAAVINGVYCHEQGCPRQRATDPDYRGDTEPPVLECDECGQMPTASPDRQDGDRCGRKLRGLVGLCGGTLREVQ